MATPQPPQLPVLYNFGEIGNTKCRDLTGPADGSTQFVCNNNEQMVAYNPQIYTSADYPGGFPVAPSTNFSITCCEFKNSFDQFIPQTQGNQLRAYVGLNPSDHDPYQDCGTSQAVASTCLVNGTIGDCYGHNLSNLWCGGMADDTTHQLYKGSDYALTNTQISSSPPTCFTHSICSGVSCHESTSCTDNPFNFTRDGPQNPPKCPDGQVLTGYNFWGSNVSIQCGTPVQNPVYTKYLNNVLPNPQKCCYIGAGYSEQFDDGSDERKICNFLDLVPNKDGTMNANCYSEMNAYCAVHLDDPACKVYCNDPHNNCDSIIELYCNANPDAPNSICGCWRPDAFANYRNQLGTKIPDAEGLIARESIPECFYPPCYNNQGYAHYASHTTPDYCPNDVICINNVNVDNQGNIQGGITVNQSNQCASYQTKDCVLDWGNWDNCSATCGGGTQTRTATISQPEQNGGVACPPADQLTQTQQCNTGACPSSDCVFTWGDWSPCSLDCGGGTQTRQPIITAQPSNGGNACPVSQTQPCNTQPCSEDCVYTWGDWSTCDKTCNGTQTRQPIITTPATPGGDGKACPSPQTQLCNPCSKKGVNYIAIVVALVVIVVGLIFLRVSRKNTHKI